MFLAQSPIKYGDNAKCKCAPICYKVSEIIVKERKIGKFMPPHTVFIQKFPNTTVQDKINTLYFGYQFWSDFLLYFTFFCILLRLCCNFSLILSLTLRALFSISLSTLLITFPRERIWPNSPPLYPHRDSTSRNQDGVK